MIIEVDIYAEIRKRYLNGESIRSIANNLGIARQTVKKYCEGNTHPEERKTYERASSVITYDIKDFILSCLKEDETENITKQKHTSKKIFDRLVNEMKFTGAYSTVRTTVRELKANQVVNQLRGMIPLSFDPGEAIQIDWGESTVYFKGQKTKVNVFCARLCYCCDIFVKAFHAANQESFLEAQQDMFDYFGGIPQKVVFDNAKVAVKEGFGIYAKPQDRYFSFSAHYAFDTEFCNPAKGNEKGLVENLVGYARRNFLVPVPRVDSIEELNDILIKACNKYRESHKVQNRTNTVKIMHNEELYYLKAIPRYRFDTSRSTITRVNEFSTVRFDKNNYSVPCRFIGKEVTIKGYGNHLYILSEGITIASYLRKYGQGHTEYRLEHYIDLLERKPRSLANAKPVKETVTRELIEWGKLLPGGNKEMVKLLRLCVDYGEDKILRIKEGLPSQVIPTVDMVRSYLKEHVESTVVYLKNEITITEANLKLYDEKFGVANQ